MNLSRITPHEAKRLVDDGAVLIDIRAPAEHARERIPGARNVPLGSSARLDGKAPIVFHCRSGMRTSANAEALAASANCQAYILDGGLDAWKRAGLPVALDRSQPIEIIRQVQIAAGSLVLLGMLLGFLVSPKFYLLSAFVGAGLLFAGLSGWCGMAKLLGLMPWNRRGGTTPSSLTQ
ncbi:MAG TPA: rhodanese family protein [Methyloceanibacter sp.]|nr:rhodanese family protein [Methyloceanibacter sp.]